MNKRTLLMAAALVLGLARCSGWTTREAGDLADAADAPDDAAHDVVIAHDDAGDDPDLVDVDGPNADDGSVTGDTDVEADAGAEKDADVAAAAEDVTGEEVTEVDSAVDDGACQPDCAGKECGPDGCGGLCGYCEYGFVCKEGSCEEICIPNCIKEGRICGSDGCGGSCGDCKEGFECNDDEGACYPVVCEPDCTGRQCGPDGCGGSCGECAAGQSCTDDGSCVTGPCKGVDPEVGACDGDVVMYCVTEGDQQILVKIDCSKDPDKACGWDPWEGKWACIDKPACEPDCTDKECGDDGCGGSCGECPEGWGCPGFKCRPVEGASCGYINEVGQCWFDNWLYYCSGPSQTGKIIAQDCTSEGKVCAYDKEYTHTYQCMNPY